MSDITLLNAYRKSEDDEIDRWLLAESRATKPATTPKPGASAAQPSHKPGEGFFNSVKRAVGAVKDRIVEGGTEMADALYPATDQPTGATAKVANEVGEGLARYSQFGQGTLKLVFPFGAGAGSLAKDVNSLLPEIPDEQIYAQIQQLREQALREPQTGGSVSSTVQQIQQLEAWLLMSPDQRTKAREEAVGMAVEALAGTVCGYSRPAQPGKPKTARR